MDTPQSKYHWTEKLDVFLVDCLSELTVQKGWKSDIGFRGGYQIQVEKMMREKLLDCGVKANPHILSRVKYLKKQAMAVHEMVAQSGSGFVWDDVRQCVDCERDVFDNWVLSHPSAKGLFRKRFPQYYTLVEIYWKNRANGGVTTNPGLAEEDCATNSMPDESFGIDESDAAEFTSVATSSGVPQSSRLKRNRGSDAFVSSMENLASGMNKLVEATVQYLSTLTNVLSNQESDISSKVTVELQKIADLSTREKLFATNAIICNPSMAHMFMATPEDKRKEFIDEVLKI